MELFISGRLKLFCPIVVFNAVYPLISEVTQKVVKLRRDAVKHRYIQTYLVTGLV